LTYQAEMFDNRSDSATATSERFDYAFGDTTIGWQQISIPWTTFARATDFQPSGAPDDGFTLTEIWGWAIMLPSGTDTVYFDDVALYGVTEDLDTEAPTWNVPSSVMVSTDTGASTAVVNYIATPSDNVGVVSSSCSPVSGSVFALGTTTLNCTAPDASGNVGTDSFDVIAEDNEAPIWSVPADVTVIAAELDGVSVSYVATVSDNVGITGDSCTPVSDSTFAIGATTVTCTATDAAGNMGTASFNVSVGVDEGSIDTLIEGIENLGLSLGGERSLKAPLESVRKLIGDANAHTDMAACSKLAGFLEHVADRHSDGSLSGVEANALTVFGQTLSNEFDCP
jgi:hypothetical protein